MNRSFVQGLRESQLTAQESRNRDVGRRKTFNSSNLGTSSATSSVDFAASPVDEDDASHIRLVSRYISREAASEAFEGCEKMTLTRLFKEVHPPAFAPPPYSNFVVLGIVARRSEYRQSSNAAAAGRSGRYVMMWLSDLKYDISLAVHGKSFEAYYKVRPGTLVGILNPRFYVQRQEEGMNLCLSISSANCVVEIGQAKDLGQCEGMSSMGTSREHRCKNWVDTRKTTVCEYHQQQRARSAASKRPEFNSVPSRLWEPRTANGRKSMTIVRGGDVKWKQGLHVDAQAPPPARSELPASVPGAPVGRVFQSGRKGRFVGDDDDRYDKPLVSDQKQRQRDKRKRDEIKEEARMRKRLAMLPSGFMLREFDEKGRVLETDTTNNLHDSRAGSNAYTAADVRRIGFNPARRAALMSFEKPRSINVGPPMPQTSQCLPELGSESDSDLEIEPPSKDDESSIQSIKDLLSQANVDTLRKQQNGNEYGNGNECGNEHDNLDNEHKYAIQASTSTLPSSP